jgi:hypothetical protein
MVNSLNELEDYIKNTCNWYNWCTVYMGKRCERCEWRESPRAHKVLKKIQELRERELNPQGLSNLIKNRFDDVEIVSLSE